MTISQSIIIGIISGLLASSLFYLLIQIFNKVIIPWYQDIIYKGVIIEGEWVGQKKFNTTNVIQDDLVEIKQHANKLRGTRTITKRFNNP